MILLQLSSGQGPAECCLAVGLAMKKIEKQCVERDMTLHVLSTVAADTKHCFKSVLLRIDSTNNVDNEKQLARSWQGAILWVCESPFRPKHRRKNWFISGEVYTIDEPSFDNEVTFTSCKSSGAGGQHVNTTNSAVRALHTSTGISVRVENERSQHANKRLAKALLFQKLALIESEQQCAQEKARWQQHIALQRGNPVRTFYGEKFKERT